MYYIYSNHTLYTSVNKVIQNKTIVNNIDITTEEFCIDFADDDH